jgi:hypothetical protein
MPFVKRGDLVEFTDAFQTDYTMGDPMLARYGVAIEDATTHDSVVVKLADGSTVAARHIMAYAWGGWMPADLEAVYAEVNGTEDGGYWDDEDAYL